jgi:phosphatidylserine decarboxylase
VLRSIRENLFMLLQRVLPARLLGRAIYAVTRSQAPWLKNLMIRGFVRLYGVDVTEADEPVPQGYPSFNAFFTRRLKPGSRPIDPDPASVVSPADGTIQQVGRLQGDEILQVKGMGYSAAELLGDDATRFRDGSFVTIYLAPWNYHRMHMPVTGRIHRMTHVPGELWSVNATTAARVPRLFARNERLVCQGEAPWGPFAVVLVGALNVGSISTTWAGEVLPRRGQQPRHWDYTPADITTCLERGAILGQFNMGSTVVVLLPPGAARWRAGLDAGDLVRTGEALGWLDAGAPRAART